MGAGETVQIVERKSAPGRAQNSQPRHAVLGIEQGAGEAQCIENFGAVFQFFKLDGAKWDRGFMKGLRDGQERLARTG